MSNTLEAGPTPPNLLNITIPFLSGVLFDKAPYGKRFGDVLRQPCPLVYSNDSVSASFVSINYILKPYPNLKQKTLKEET